MSLSAILISTGSELRTILPGEISFSRAWLNSWFYIGAMLHSTPFLLFLMYVFQLSHCAAAVSLDQFHVVHFLHFPLVRFLLVQVQFQVLFLLVPMQFQLFLYLVQVRLFPSPKSGILSFHFTPPECQILGNEVDSQRRSHPWCGKKNLFGVNSIYNPFWCRE